MVVPLALKGEEGTAHTTHPVLLDRQHVQPQLRGSGFVEGNLNDSCSGVVGVGSVGELVGERSGREHVRGEN